jgi:opacity protein-like surface antigen
MGNYKLTLSALAGAVMFLIPPAQSFAADMPYTYAPPPVEYSSNWYLRGDIGYKIYAAPSAHWDEIGYGSMVNESLSDAGLVGLGFGYKWNDSFRTDFTIDYEWPGKFHGNLPCPGDCESPYSDEYADFSVFTGLLNAYFDLGTWSGFTPYIGGGVGLSAINTSDVRYVNPDSTTGSWDGGTSWNLAWALMAGFAYDFGNNWLLDVNYRYVDLGDAKSGTIPLMSGTQSIQYDGITAQEFRVGFRYMLH